MFYPSLYGGGLSNLSASLEAGQARADAREAQTGVELMQHDIERLLMITEALWLFIKTQHNYTDEDLVKVIMDIELRDSHCPNISRSPVPPAAGPIPASGPSASIAANRFRWFRSRGKGGFRWGEAADKPPFRCVADSISAHGDTRPTSINSKKKRREPAFAPLPSSSSGGVAIIFWLTSWPARSARWRWSAGCGWRFCRGRPASWDGGLPGSPCSRC